MPYYEDKVEYTFEDLVLLTVKTAPLVENPAIKATVTLDEVTATSVVISLVPAEGGSTAYEHVQELLDKVVNFDYQTLKQNCDFRTAQRNSNDRSEDSQGSSID